MYYDSSFFAVIGTEIRSAIRRVFPSKEKKDSESFVIESEMPFKSNPIIDRLIDSGGRSGIDGFLSQLNRTGEFTRPRPHFDDDDDDDDAGVIDRGGTEDFPIVTIEEDFPTTLRFMRRNSMRTEHCRAEIDISRIKEGERIPFKYKNCDCELICKEGTRVISCGDTVSNIIFMRPDVYYRTPGEPKAFPCDCICALDDENYRLFDFEDDIEEKSELIRTFSKLSSPQRKHVLSLASRPEADNGNDASSSDGVFTPIRDEKALDMMFKVCRHTYPENVIARAEILRDQLEHCSGSERNDIVTQLAYTLGIDTTAHFIPPKTYEEYKAIMDKHIYGMEDFKQAVVEFIIAMKMSGASYLSMLLVGPPGVGKTSVCNAVAECLSVDMVHVDCSGVDSITMSGLVRSYSGAKAGKVVEGFFNAGKTDVLVRLDELDKMTKGKEGDPYSGLIKPLGPQRSYFDEYVAADTDVSATKFIATANSLDTIPGYILSRFENCIFHIAPYTEKEKLEIAKHHIIPKQLKQFRISADECIFEDDAINVIIREFCADEGVRELEGNIVMLMRKILTEYYRGVLQKPFKVDEDFVRSRLLKTKSYCHSAKIGFAS